MLHIFTVWDVFPSYELYGQMRFFLASLKIHENPHLSVNHYQLYPLVI